MPTFYHNAENALNRANEFCELGKEHEALDCLYDVLKNRKSKMAKEIHEKIINKFLELCVELKKSQMAKDGLYSYRNICQQVNLKSWEDAVRKYIHLSQSKVESAQNIFQSSILDVDDLDQDLTPEILLKTVSKEGAQDRSERIILLPWIKFLWECHRNCLDLLKTPQTEKLYHTVAQNALQFCVKNSRKSELRKLCSILRIYKIYIQKRQAYSKAEDSESQLLMCLETGFIELESAISMELWQDAFKAIEDIHSIINISKKFQQSRIMAHYYDKFSCVLWKGEEYLFHAAAVLRYFQILKDQKKNLNLEDITNLACRVFLSILAIPIATANPMVDLIAETDVSVLNKNYTLLSSLLHLQKCPTRNSLIKDVVAQRVDQYLPKELNDLFQAIEYDLKPGELHSHISAATKFTENYDDLKQYMPLIHKCAVVKLIPVLFNMYTNIKLSKLQYYTGITDISDLEIILVDSARKYEIPLRIDHRNMSVHFSADFNIFKNETALEADSNCNNQHLKCLMRTYNGLKNIVSIIYPERLKDVNVSIAENIARRYKRKKEFYRKQVLLRKKNIEKHKEHLESLRIQKEEEERKLLAEKVLQHEINEKERLLRENEERNLQRIQREQEQIKRKILLEKMENLKKSVLGSQLAKSIELDDLDNFDPELLFTKQIEQYNKEKKALSSKLHRQERILNHLERAKRIEEVPLLRREYDLYQENHFEAWKKDQQNKFDLAIRIRTTEVQKKKRYLEIKSDLENFLKQVKKGRLDAYFTKEEYLQTLKTEKQRRLKERAAKRKEARRNRWNEQKELKRKENQMRSNKVDVCCGEDIRAKENRQIIKENVREDSAKSFLYPQRSSTCHPEREFHFIERLNNREASSFLANTKKKDFTENSEGTETITKDKYFYSKTYKPHLNETDRIKSFECSSPLSNVFSNIYPSSKREVYKSSYYRARGETTLFEKREETELSWRTTSSSNSNFNIASAMQNQRFKEEDPAHQKTYIILQRKETTSAQPKVSESNTDTSSDSQKIIRNEPEHSRTPWAKLKRKEQDS